MISSTLLTELAIVAIPPSVVVGCIAYVVLEVCDLFADEQEITRPTELSNTFIAFDPLDK